MIINRSQNSERTEIKVVECLEIRGNDTNNHNNTSSNIKAKSIQYLIIFNSTLSYTHFEERTDYKEAKILKKVTYTK